MIIASRELPWIAESCGECRQYIARAPGFPDARVIWNGPGYNFMLLDRFTNEDADIPAGFIFDAASIPRFFWSIPGLSPLDLGTYSVLVHDWKYELGEGRRRDADRLFLAYMKREGIRRWPRYPAYGGVAAFGEPHWGGEA